MNERMRNTRRRVLAGALSTTIAIGLGGGAANAQPKVIHPDYCPALEVLRADPGQSLANYCKVALMRTLRAARFTDTKRPWAISAYKRQVNSLDLNKEDLEVNGALDAQTAASILEGKGLEMATPVQTKKGRVAFINKAAQLSYLISGGKIRDILAVSTGMHTTRKNVGQRGNMFTPEGRFRLNENVEGPNYHDGEMGSAQFMTINGTTYIYAHHSNPDVPLDAEPKSHGCVRYTKGTMEAIVAPFLEPGDTTVISHNLPGWAKKDSRQMYFDSINSTSTSTTSSPAVNSTTGGTATTSATSKPR